MELYDPVTGRLAAVAIQPRMTVYVCGITPYDASHLGHAFTYAHFDVLVRHLRHLGANVEHVQNVTDVDDDMLRVSRERGIDYLQLAARETAEFDRTMRALGNQPPTRSPRATEFVPDIVEEVQAILGTGRAYEREGNVYFRVASDPGYGQLSRLSRERMLALAAERGGNPEDPLKDDPLDFVVWQRSAPGEPWWQSPWGRGRPGWHIECSTMARRLLGQPVDIHGGGADLIFPHHESEISQAEAVSGGRPFVSHWMHTGMVGYQGEKMSKSLGNLVFVNDLIDRYGPARIRRLVLERHYREDWTFSEGSLEPGSEPTGASPPPTVPVAELRRAFFAALDQDLDTPRALAALDAASATAEAGAAELVEEGRTILGFADG